MDRPPQKSPESRLSSAVPWLHLFGSLMAFVLISLFMAQQSELGRAISTGESPLFSWVGSHMPLLLLIGLAYLIGVQWAQYLETRTDGGTRSSGMKILISGECFAVSILVLGILKSWQAALFWGHTLFQLSILSQTFVALWRSQKREPALLRSDHLGPPERHFFLFLSFLFILAALPAALDPSWISMAEHVQLDSKFEALLSRALPPVFSGVTALWFGIVPLIILVGFRAGRRRGANHDASGWAALYVPFLAITGIYAALWLKSLTHAIDWELSKLNLKANMVPLFILLCGGGGALFAETFRRIGSHFPSGGERSRIALVALSMGALVLLPITWTLTGRRSGPWSWRLLVLSCLLASVLMGAYVLYGNLFNPWFTAFSYLKVAILKTLAVVGAGSLVLIIESFSPSPTGNPPKVGRVCFAAVAIFFLGFFPFALSERYREAKVASLQFNELSRVDATYGRELAKLIGLDRWVRLGQDPDENMSPEPWPLPWTLRKTHPSLLPKDFNILVIVVDALRGDAFRSAGYGRNLTPFLDHWALEEAVSFRRAYSQGGGSFAAFPFLVSGRSTFDLYGPGLHRKNLYLKVAQAEGIRHFMVIKEFGPRAIFPPDFPVIELDKGKVRPDRRSVPADRVFGWAQEAIDKFPGGERFLGFLHLMDVHNDLWKKEGGLDFGDSPRDLYDNNLSYLDRAFSRFVAWLKKKGIYERTVILFTSDHGEQFWEHGASLHGHTLYEEEIRVPLILLTHRFRRRIEDIPVVVGDMAPTLADLAGYSVNPPYDDPHMGISIVPLLKGGDRSRYLKRDVVGRASFKRRYFLYRNWEWKLVYFAELDLLQLFNPLRDPGERVNFLQEEPGVARDMERELFRYLQRVERKTYRPLLSGDP